MGAIKIEGSASTLNSTKVFLGMFCIVTFAVCKSFKKSILPGDAEPGRAGAAARELRLAAHRA